jgi:hypothetical protein
MSSHGIGLGVDSSGVLSANQDVYNAMRLRPDPAAYPVIPTIGTDATLENPGGSLTQSLPYFLQGNVYNPITTNATSYYIDTPPISLPINTPSTTLTPTYPSTSPSPSHSGTTALACSTSPEPVFPEDHRARAAHNVVEKQYRSRLNSQFDALLHVLPTERSKAGVKSYNEKVGDRKAGARKMRKADVLELARQYIQVLESRINKLSKENAELMGKLGRGC